MSTFTDMAQGTAWDSLAAMHGQTVTYTADGVAGASIAGIWHPNQVLPQFYPDSQQDVEYGVIQFNPVDVTSPSNQDTVTIGGNVWSVASIGSESPYVEFQLVRHARLAIGRGHEVKR